MNIMKKALFVLSAVGFLGVFNCGLTLAEGENFTIIIKDHKFSPEELIIPANKKVKIIIDNQDATPEEFESFDLNREKIVPANGQVTIFVGPLKPGRYKYFGEFHQDTAQGIIVVQ